MKMMKGITKIKATGKFRVTMELDPINGKRNRPTKHFDTYEEAEKFLIEFNYNKQKNMLVIPNKMTFAEFLVSWMENYVQYNCEETTIYGYKNIINNHVIPYFGGLDLQKLQPAHIQKYYKHLLDEKGLSPNTVHKHHANIRKALGYALKQQLINRNIAEAVEVPRKRKFEGNFYIQDQLATLLHKVRDTKIEVPVYLASYLGLRREEICGLKWKNVNFSERIIYIKEVRVSAGNKTVTKRPKTDNSQRALYMEDDLYEVLQKCKAKYDKYKVLLGSEFDDAGYVYSKSNGKPYKVNYITDQFKEFLQRNDLPIIRLHDLRHSFASILYDEGLDLKSISEALGHSNVGTTDKIYAHRIDKFHKKTTSVLSAALKKTNDLVSMV